MSKGGGSTQTTKQELPAELRPLAKAYTERAMEVGQLPFQPYTGQRFAGMTGDQVSALDMIRQRATGGSPVMSQANSTLMGMLQGGQTNPYLDSMVDRAQQSVVRNYNLGVKPAIESGMVRSGSFGNSGLQQMQGESQRQLGETLGDIGTQMYGQAYDQDRARQLSALGMAPTFGNQAYTDAAQLLGAGALQQQQAQQPLDFAYQQHQGAQEHPYKQLGALGAPFGANMGGSTSASGGGNGAASALGGALGGAQLGSMLFGTGGALAGLGGISAGMGSGLGALGGLLALSDRRTKKDIKRVGKTDDGLPIYTYRYKHGGPMQMGVMAQEAAKKRPEAVHDVGGGLLAVDYGAI